MKKIHDLHNYDGCFNTRSGIKFNILEPTEDMIDILDISHALSYNCHFGGQTPEFFSIAQHCLLTLSLLPYRWKEHKPELALAALLHDAAEAYVGDMIKPLKVMIPKFSEIEDRILEVIFKKFNIRIEYLKTVKKYDLEAQEIEFMVFFEKKGNLMYLSPEASNFTFVDKYYELINKRNG